MLVQQFPELPSLSWALLLVPLAVAARWRPAFGLPALLIAAGAVWVTLRAGIILEETLARELEGEDLVVEGCVADVPVPTDFGYRFRFDVRSARQAGRVVEIPSRILLSAGQERFAPRAGECWRLAVRLKRPHGLRNPGGFDYEAWLFRERLRATGYVRPDPAPIRLEAEESWRYAVDRLRQALGERIRAALPQEDPFVGMVEALANGVARGITPAQWQTLRATGTVHLVAISGMHITLVAGMVFFLARWLWAVPGYTVLRVPAPVAAAAAALAAAAAYAALAGFAIPTQRALIMLAVSMSGLFLRRRLPPSQLLAAALAAVLLYDPLAVMAGGFWLSFAAVAVILYVMPETHGGGSGGGRRWRQWIGLQGAITLGMLPLMLALFQQVSLAAPLANLVAIPVFDFAVVPLTLLGAALLPLAPAAAAGLWGLASAVLALLWPVLEFLGGLALSQWTQAAPPAWAVAAAVVGVLWLLAPRGFPSRWVGAVWLAPLLLVRPGTPAPGELWFTLLDVGQGLAAVVRTANHTLVYDTGARFSAQFDAGQAVVVPYLRAQGVRRIDTLVVSHGDNDHRGGAAAVLDAYPAARVLSSVAALGAAAEVRPCREGEAWEWDGVRFTLLNPPHGRFSRHNNASCVLRIESRYGSVLLPGDIEARAEQRLVERYGPRLAAEVLVAPHHGSRSSSTETFIASVRPRYVLVPAGYRNRYRHPHPEVLARYRRAGARLYGSAASGALELRLTAAGIGVEAFRERARRYWHARPDGF